MGMPPARRNTASSQSAPPAAMEARSVDAIPRGSEWQYEPKWDGFRCLLSRHGDKVELRSKSGEDLTRYFPELVEAARKLKATDFVLDGEIVVPRGKAFSFDDLLQRIHPDASRVKKLAQETPGLFIASDLLATTNGNKLVGSLLLGLYDEKGLLHDVGFTSAIKQQEKPALTAKLELLIAKPGFTGNAPGGPSRWSTERSAQWCPLKPKLVVEVAYDHFSGERFRHGTSILRWRPDKAPRQCTFDQLKQKAADPMKLLA